MIRNILHPEKNTHPVRLAGPPAVSQPIVYILSTTNLLKIGYTSNKKYLRYRLAECRESIPYPVRILYTFPGTREVANHLHTKFSIFSAPGHWYENNSQSLTLLKEYTGSWLGPEPYHYNLNSMLLYFLNIIDYEQYDKDPVHERPIA